MSHLSVTGAVPSKSSALAHYGWRCDASQGPHRQCGHDPQHGAHLRSCTRERQERPGVAVYMLISVDLFEL